MRRLNIPKSVIHKEAQRFLQQRANDIARRESARIEAEKRAARIRGNEQTR
jgi:hypothetical protein